MQMCMVKYGDAEWRWEVSGGDAESVQWNSVVMAIQTRSQVVLDSSLDLDCMRVSGGHTRQPRGRTTAGYEEKGSVLRLLQRNWWDNV